MNRREFEQLVERAIERIPQIFQKAMENVAITVADWPDPDVMEEMTGDRNEVVYGLFTGTPLPERSVEMSGDMPAMIELYQMPLVEDFPDRRDLIEEIEITLVHEIAHFMGMDEEEIREQGYE